MIERYTLPEMGAIWTDRAKFQSWLDVEVAACEANCSLGRVPEPAMEDIRNNMHPTHVTAAIKSGPPAARHPPVATPHRPPPEYF